MHTTKITKSFSHKYQVGDTVYYYGQGRMQGLQETKVVEVYQVNEDDSGSYVRYKCTNDYFDEDEIAATKQEIINKSLAILDQNIQIHKAVIDRAQKEINQQKEYISSLQQRKQDLIAQLP